jgi:hypothetical protein
METELKDYFENLIEDKMNPYIHYNTYDNAILTENRIPLTEIGQPDKSKCVTENEQFSMLYWKKCFNPSDFAALKYGNFIDCGYQIIIDIVKRINGKEITLDFIKATLYKSYFGLFDKYRDKLINILEIEGKKYLTDQLERKIINLVDFIFSDEYFITNFDLIILMIEFQIPAIIISHKPVFLSLYERRFLILNKSLDESNKEYVFIITSPSRNEHIVNYKLINKIEDNSILISLDELDCNKRDNIIDAIKEYTADIDSFLASYQIKKKTKYQERAHLSELNESLRLEPPVPEKRATESAINPNLLRIKKPKIVKKKGNITRKILSDENITKEKRIIEELITTYTYHEWNKLRKNPSSDIPSHYNQYRALSFPELKKKYGIKLKTKRNRQLLHLEDDDDDDDQEV